MLNNFRRRLSLPQWQQTLYILFFAQLMSAVGFASIFPFLSFYVEDLGSTTNLSLELLAGLVFSAQAFTMMLTSPIWGALADRYGRKVMIERATFGGAVLLLLMAFVQSAEQLVLIRAIQGAVTGVVTANNALAAAETPRERSGFAMGMLQVGMGAGVAVGPLIGGVLADLWGYRVAFYGTSALLLLAGILVRFGVTENFDPEQAKGHKQTSMFADWRRVLTSEGIPIAYAMRFMSQLARMMIVPIAPFFVELLMGGSHANLNTMVGLVIGSASATMTISGIYLGNLGDRIGHRRILITSIFLGGALYLVQGSVMTAWQLLILQALTGIAIGGIITTISALLARFSEPGDEGAVYGLDNSINAAGRAAAPMLGSGVALLFDLRATFTFTGLLLLVAGGLAWWFLPAAQPVEAVQQPAAD